MDAKKYSHIRVGTIIEPSYNEVDACGWIKSAIKRKSTIALFHPSFSIVSAGSIGKSVSQEEGDCAL